MKTQLRISFLKHSVIIGKIREKSNKFPPCSWFLYFLRRVIRVNCGNWGAGGGRSELLMSFALRWPRKSSDLSSEVGAVYELRIANELRFFYLPFTHALFFFVHRTRSRRRSAYQRSWHSAHFCRILKEKLGRPCYCIVNRWRCCRIFIFCPHSLHSSKCWLLWLKVPTDGTVVDPPSPSSICCVERIMKFCDLDPFRVTNSFIWFDYREHKF